MRTHSPADLPWLRLYARAVELFPAGFRAAYADQVLLTARDAVCDQAPGTRGALYRILTRDLVLSLVREHVRNARSLPMKRPVAVYSIALFVVLSVFGCASAVTMQQLLRRSANQPQQQMAERYAAALSAGERPETLLPSGRIDLSSNLEPFVMVYDDEGHPLRGNGFLNGAAPVPPAGVFTHAREQGSDTLSWQPRRDTRIALVVQRVTGAHPGFVAAGRSLSVTEQYESVVYRMALFGWVGLLLLVVGGAALLGRATRPPRTMLAA